MKTKDLQRKFMGQIRHFRSKKFQTKIDLCEEEDNELAQRLRHKKPHKSQNEILKNVTNFIFQDSPDDPVPGADHLLKKRSGISANKVLLIKTEQDDSDAELVPATEKSFDDILIFSEKVIEKDTRKLRRHRERHDKRVEVLTQSPALVTESGLKSTFDLEIVNDSGRRGRAEQPAPRERVDPNKPTLLKELMENLRQGRWKVEKQFYFDCRITSLVPLRISENYLNQISILKTDEISRQLEKANFSRILLNVKVLFKKFEVILFGNRGQSRTKGVMLRLCDPHVYTIARETSIRINFRIPSLEENEVVREIYRNKYSERIDFDFESSIKATQYKGAHVCSENFENVIVMKSETIDGEFVLRSGKPADERRGSATTKKCEERNAREFTHLNVGSEHQKVAMDESQSPTKKTDDDGPDSPDLDNRVKDPILRELDMSEKSVRGGAPEKIIIIEDLGRKKGRGQSADDDKPFESRRRRKSRWADKGGKGRRARLTEDSKLSLLENKRETMNRGILNVFRETLQPKNAKPKIFAREFPRRRFGRRSGFHHNNEHLNVLQENSYIHSEKNDKEISKEMEIYDKLTWRESVKRGSAKKGPKKQESFDDADNVFLYKKLRKLQRNSNRVPRGRYKRKFKIRKNTKALRRSRGGGKKGERPRAEPVGGNGGKRQSGEGHKGFRPKAVDCTDTKRKAKQIEIISFANEEGKQKKTGKESAEPVEAEAGKKVHEGSN